MNSRLRNGIIIAVLGLAFIIFGVFVVMTGLRAQTNVVDNLPTQEAPVTTDVVMTTHDLPLGALLQERDLTLVAVPVGLVPRNAVTSIESAVNTYIKFQLVSGEMLLQHHLADPTNVNRDLAFILLEDHVLMAFPANDLMSRQGIIEKGNIIDIYVSLEAEVQIFESGTFGSVEEERVRALFTFNALQHVEITAMVVEIQTAQSDGTSTSQTTTVSGDPIPGEEVNGEVIETAPRTVEIKAYLLALKPQDALILKFLRDSGAIFDFVIRNPTNLQPFALTPVTAEFIRELYGLEILR